MVTLELDPKSSSSKATAVPSAPYLPQDRKESHDSSLGSQPFPSLALSGEELTQPCGIESSRLSAAIDPWSCVSLSTQAWRGKGKWSPRSSPLCLGLASTAVFQLNCPQGLGPWGHAKNYNEAFSDFCYYNHFCPHLLRHTSQSFSRLYT